MQAAWDEVAVTDDSLVQCIHDIRRALNDDSHAVLQTAARRGYRLVILPERGRRAAAAGRRSRCCRSTSWGAGAATISPTGWWRT